MFIEILFKMLLFKGVYSFMLSNVYIYIYIYIYIDIDILHLHLIILQTLLSKATYNLGIHKAIHLEEANRQRK